MTSPSPQVRWAHVVCTTEPTPDTTEAKGGFDNDDDDDFLGASTQKAPAPQGNTPHTCTSFTRLLTFSPLSHSLSMHSHAHTRVTPGPPKTASTKSMFDDDDDVPAPAPQATTSAPAATATPAKAKCAYSRYCARLCTLMCVMQPCSTTTTTTTTLLPAKVLWGARPPPPLCLRPHRQSVMCGGV